MDNLNYWQTKAVSWHKKRYDSFAKLNPFSWPIQNRMQLAQKICLEIVPDKPTTVLDLGCGTAKFAEIIKKNKNIRYIGYDISSQAIQIAKNNFKECILETNDIRTIHNFPKHDVSVLLGLSDWLNFEENKQLLQKLNSPYILFSYTVSQRSIKNQIYTNYRKFQDKNRATALSWPTTKIENLVEKTNYSIIRKSKISKMSPGILLCLKKNTSI